MNERSKVLLPVNYPPITSWQWHASLFSILANEEYALNWIYSNYIQLRCYPEKDEITNNSIFMFDFIPGDSSLKECPYLLTEIITIEQILSYSTDFLTFLLKTLDLSYYIFGICDETNMLNRGRRILHQLFIYGYDLEAQVFYVGDFTFARNYSYTAVPFDKVIEGFINVQPGEDFVFNHNYKEMRGLYLIKKNTDEKYYSFDVNFVKRSFNEYLYGLNTKEHFLQMRNMIDTNSFGVNTYDSIIKQLDLIKEKKNTWYDYRPFHIMYDHKVLMWNRLNYMMKNKYLTYDRELLDNYELVKSEILKARNTFIKANVKKDIGMLDKIKSYIIDTRNMEIEILSKVEKQI
ncbi:hypothetical protein LY28_02485 [Ruminiclostridium sufflavum DSM 19573]|uniref:Uncharacterized protein n=1 Tax=Ruminiclostridium sufflavum DSM 19573 TaxID=1121337 RepID=A0A318XME4_9FIRM|nr:hypothetical protein [Ruminiclostridium sufflavum]PYG87102.1 hypothetical protein LY28_02485 [Ruminiclostridium sufflavum DSM 19573]